VHCVNL